MRQAPGPYSKMPADYRTTKKKKIGLQLGQQVASLKKA